MGVTSHPMFLGQKPCRISCISVVPNHLEWINPTCVAAKDCENFKRFGYTVGCENWVEGVADLFTKWWVEMWKSQRWSTIVHMDILYLNGNLSSNFKWLITSNDFHVCWFCKAFTSIHSSNQRSVAELRCRQPSQFPASEVAPWKQKKKREAGSFLLRYWFKLAKCLGWECSFLDSSCPVHIFLGVS